MTNLRLKSTPPNNKKNALWKKKSIKVEERNWPIRREGGSSRRRVERWHHLGWGGFSSSSWEEGEGLGLALGLEWKEGKGFSPLMIQPRAKKAVPARMAVPQAWEYHLLYCLMAYLHWSLRVAESGFTVSGGLICLLLCPEYLVDPPWSPPPEEEEEEEGGRGVLGLLVSLSLMVAATVVHLTVTDCFALSFSWVHFTITTLYIYIFN